jgi:hypothetical protein
MNEIKYVMTSIGPILFGGGMKHSDFTQYEILSAGFVSISTNKIGQVEAMAYGESISLKIKSDSNDSRKITKFLNEEF